MTTMPFAPLVVGDFCHLKSGGPTMTVEVTFSGGKTVNCVWFTKLSPEPQRASFQAAVLVEGRMPLPRKDR